MPTTIRFWKHKFISRKEKQMPISDYETSAEYAIQEVEQTKNKPEVIKNGSLLTPITFSVHLVMALGVVPETEYKKLKRLCEKGVPYKLYRNGKLESKKKFFLRKVAQSGVVMNLKGAITEMSLSLEFIEFSKQTTKEKEEAKAEAKRKKK